MLTETADFSNLTKNSSSATEFSLAGTSCWGLVVDVHDGDSMKCVIELYKDLCFVFTIRLADIDTAEITSKNTEVKATALKARNRVVSLLTSKNVQNWAPRDTRGAGGARQDNDAVADSPISWPRRIIRFHRPTGLD